jgi:hypothetical protein
MERPCMEAGCGEFAVYRGRCGEHARLRSRATERIGRTVYNSKRWRLTRLRKLSLNPICERCDRALATDVHHVYGVEHDPWALDGLQSLCHSCHSKISAGSAA